MAKKRALSIKAIVTQNSLDSDGNTVVTNEGTYYFPIELFLYDYISGTNLRYEAKSTAEGLRYFSFDGDPSEMLTSLDTVFNSPDTLEDKTLNHHISDYTETTVRKYNKELFNTSYKGSGSVYYVVGSSLNNYYDNTNDFGKFVRYEFLSLSDEAYNKFIEVWKDKITKSLNSEFPDLVGEITLVFTNSATTEE